MPPDPPSMGRLRGSCLRQPCGLHPQIWKPPSSNPGSATGMCYYLATDYTIAGCQLKSYQIQRYDYVPQNGPGNTVGLMGVECKNMP